MADMTSAGFLKDIQENLDDFPTYLIYADFLEDQGDEDSAFAYRWMGNKQHRPWHRSDLKQPRWVWLRGDKPKRVPSHEFWRKGFRLCP